MDEDGVDHAMPDPALDHPVVDPVARVSYAGVPFLPGEVDGAPLPLLQRWYTEAVGDDRIVEPGAMVVATVDEGGLPDARTVLLKGMDADGLTFFTNLTSTKAQQLSRTPFASAVLLWHPMYRQVRVRGPVTRVSAAEDFWGGFRLLPQVVELWVGRRSRLHDRVVFQRVGDGDLADPASWRPHRLQP
jgi:pyridoxamine 5'-phosphate oxidase